MTPPRFICSGAVLVAALTACGDDVASRVQVVPTVAAAAVVSVELDEEIRASGELRARNHTTIAAEISGRVTQILIDEGGSAESGTIVLELDPERRNLELEAASARASEAEAKLAMERSQTERVRKLRSSDINSEAQLEEAETALRLASSKLAAERAERGVARRALSDASVSAPFAGLVAERYVQLGEFVQPGGRLFELVSLDPLEAVFHVPELDASRVRVGQRVGITVAAHPQRRFEGTVQFVSPTVDPATRTLRIKAEITNSAGLLRPGFFARASLGVDRRSGVIMVPEESLIQRADGAVLFRIGADRRVERIAVETGADYEGMVEVRGPLRVGDLVVRRGHGGLADGALVELLEGDRATAEQREGAPGLEAGL